ncbi:NADH-quinone oxidoreductase subunit C [Ferruginibacter paludis]|jgi:NADH-quinone oxidoreductase subunit C|uniref:NADH-quinone oxidoreductase subunit C n=1 Tax=Ferruginibacter paludis TaxID=1310417 RepID=UPI0025B62974|nr:NADH-quinone oxidoreductase subunit C [Ferruginibacter paludis]MDN3658558.1 NADH-quinone oxidoreductase subunit C [Ferruginibacter paludis]
MTNEALKEKILQLSPAVSFEEGGQWLTIIVTPAAWHSLAAQLRNDKALFFNFLFCLTCIDWKTHLTMVYHLESVQFRHNIVIKSKLDAADPSIATVSDIWQTANFHEREVYEMFGVNFINHPDLRLLILPDGWENKRPLLKNFEDPVNMIKL